MESSPTESTQTRWLTKNNLVRPGIYIPREVWERFEQAVAVKNYERAKEGKRPLSRTSAIAILMEMWSTKMLDKH